MWQFWIDRGGTFTDVIAQCSDGQRQVIKLLSEHPLRYQDAALYAIRQVLKLDATIGIPADVISAVKMGTTVATNALLERKGEPAILLITQGFKDALKIAYQNRPHIFARDIKQPQAIYDGVVEAHERLRCDGKVLKKLDRQRAKDELQQAYDAGFRAIAIVLMHAYRYPQHEQALQALAEDIGFTQISVSHQVSPLIKLIKRADITTVDAYLTPILQRYIDQFTQQIGDSPLFFMQSNGGLTQAQSFRGKNSILSGPAAGVVGAVQCCQAAGFDKIINIDMGGTSTDVSHFAGQYERSNEAELAGVRLLTPMMRIHTIAAGGGSIIHFSDGRYQVGPESAGAKPGPACYRQQGPLTITDCNVMLGKLQANFFPKLFGDQYDQALDVTLVQQAFQKLAEKIQRQTADSRSPIDVAAGFINVAVDSMANAIKKISVQRGYDITQYTLCCFGGASAQHACLIADRLTMPQVFIPRQASVLSAYGMGLADVRVIKQQSIEEEFTNRQHQGLKSLLAALVTASKAELKQQGIDDKKAMTTQQSCLLKFRGATMSFAVAYQTYSAMIADLKQQHQACYGFIDENKAIVVETIEVEGIATQPAIKQQHAASPATQTTNPIEATVAMVSAGRSQQTPVYYWHKLAADSSIQGPALIIEPHNTIVIEEGWQAHCQSDYLLLTRSKPRVQQYALGTHVDPVMLEVFNHLFMSIAEQMGVVLGNTAASVNIKERLDYSCALFDNHGQLVANAPHIPIHLGSMGESVRAIIQARGDSIKMGDVFMLNNPYQGGTHLPDITVITPVFDKQDKECLFYVASRGHHADIGGITPGSIPPYSHHIDEEGILIDNFHLVKDHRFREQAVVELFQASRWPARNIQQNIGDLKAQIAANEKGVVELKKTIEQFGLDVVRAYMQHIQDNAYAAVQDALVQLNDGSFQYRLDNDSVIKVSLSIDKKAKRATIDFTGSSAQLTNNFNAPKAVCRAAVLYVLRTLVDKDIPLNEGCIKAVDLIIPEKSMLNPQYPAAVVAGNVETSQYIVDALYAALGVMAASQGTMNNFTFGNANYQYYETLAGGAGAGDGFHGASAVHTHMTNSRITDPEVLERHYPIVLESFAIRSDSGGQGRWHGGDGVVRCIRFLETMSASILSSHRRYPPHGLAGGQPGKLGVNYVIKHDGQRVSLAATATVSMSPGDRFVIETPGGGGFGGQKTEDEG